SVIVRRLAKITAVEFSSYKESVRSFLVESRLAKTTSGTPLFLLNNRYGGRTVKTTGLYTAETDCFYSVRGASVQ
ncbi:hypothetical protein TSAR_014549, partial [Trichomalopsis sarcophagae]